MKKLVILLVYLISCLAMAKPPIEKGQLSSKEQMRATGTVSLIYNYGTEKSVCTGVRIHPKHVLTAYHCVSNPNSFPVGVRQALNPLDKSVKLEKIIAITMPNVSSFYERSYSSNLSSTIHDIALLVLEKESMEPFVSISSPALISDKDKLLQLGYGMTSAYDDNLEIQECNPLSFLDNATSLTKFLDDSFRLVNPKSSIRNGDSGGPILVKNADNSYSLLGVVSKGESKSLSEVTNGTTEYTDVSYFKRWIEESINDKDFKLNVLPNEKQFSGDKPYFITSDKYYEQQLDLCKGLSKKIGSTWNLNAYGFCLPQDEEMCKKITTLEFGMHAVKWSSGQKKCLRSFEED